MELHGLLRSANIVNSFFKVSNALFTLVWYVESRAFFIFFFSSRRRHTRLQGDWSSDVCSSDLARTHAEQLGDVAAAGTPVHADRRRVAVPRGRLPLEPADGVVGVLHRRRIQIGRASCRERV